MPDFVLPVFALLLLIALGFVLRFVLPAVFLLRDLRRAAAAVEALSASAHREGGIAPEDVAAAMNSPRLEHAWREYAQTLHATVAGGHRHWRATAMAETFFSTTTLVETPLKTEFYKHLPGILTGIGIIGTFAGLIAGLTHFEVTSNTEAVRASLKQLMQGVGHAFQVSALAITLAMLVTWIEKSLTTLGFRRVARLAEGIDRLFERGVEEEYLARLVRAGETSAKQGSALAQGVAAEIRTALEDWSKRQEAAAARQQEALAVAITKSVAEAVGGAIHAALREPLARMATALTQSGAAQGAALSESLTPILERWMARLEAQRGDARLEDAMRRAVEILGQTAAEMRQTTARLGEVGQTAATDAVNELRMAGQGAGRAAATFAQAGDDWSKAASELAAAAREAGAVIRDQAEARAALGLMTRDLRDLLDNARREAGLTRDLVSRLEAAGSALGQAEREAGRYLEGVNAVLAEAHARFAENVENTLRQGNAQFHRELAAAVDYLKGAIEALGDTLETLASRK
ncbi:MAG: hypothetical protein LBB51_03280 [Zoogloeaceae bacterium]|jgi:hypothetical protein|nr:hypothetical protein [Zoogloeaceae bacterium]